MGSYGVSVTDFGAVGDGHSSSGVAIQAALDAGAQYVVVPVGIYLIDRTLQIQSNTHLHLHPRAHVIFADGAGVDDSSFLLTNKDHTSGNSNITVEGGVWDGNNPANCRGPDEPGSFSGVLFNFTNVAGLTLRDLTLRDAESYFVRLGKVTKFLIEKILFEIRYLRPNQDGIHISGHCSDGVVRHLRGAGSQTPNDDMVAILADDALHRAQNLNGAFNGPIRRIRVDDLQADSCHSFVRLLSFQNSIEDIDIRNVVGGCRCCAINMDAARDCRVTLFDDADYPEGVGSIARVRVADMRVYKASDQSHQPLLDFRTHVDDFRIERFVRDKALDVSSATPTLHMTKVGTAQVTIDGLSTDQCKSLIVEDPVRDRMAKLYKDDFYRISARIRAPESLVIADGGFVRMMVYGG